MGSLCGKKPVPEKDKPVVPPGDEARMQRGHDASLAGNNNTSSPQRTKINFSIENDSKDATKDAKKKESAPPITPNANTKRTSQSTRKPLPESTNPYVEKKVVHIGFPTSRRRWRRRRVRRYYEENIWGGSLNDRIMHYTTNLVVRHVDFANRSGCNRPPEMHDPC